jgi:hypothetical protein
MVNRDSIYENVVQFKALLTQGHLKQNIEEQIPSPFLFEISTTDTER